jgi:hypothetical protein
MSKSLHKGIGGSKREVGPSKPRLTDASSVTSTGFAPFHKERAALSLP